MNVISEIQAERERQIQAEGWDADHDKAHDDGQLARAAVCYAMPEFLLNRDFSGGENFREVVWPFHEAWWKPKDRRRDLIRAAALLVAEVERMDAGEQAAWERQERKRVWG